MAKRSLPRSSPEPRHDHPSCRRDLHSGAPLNLMTPGVSLRSASGNASAVVLDGVYAADEIIFVAASNVTLAEITVTHAVNHPIHVSPPDTVPM